MFLYHGPWEVEKDKILGNGFLNNYCSTKDTKLIDNLFTKIQGINPRSNAIYLSPFEESVEFYDYGFKIHIDRLNKNLLYVGNNEIINKLYCNLLDGNNNKKVLKKLTKEYIDTFINFKEYKKYMNKYDKVDYLPEFLYFSKIKVSVNDL